MAKKNKWGTIIDEEGDKIDETHEWHSKDLSNVNFDNFQSPKKQEHNDGDEKDASFDSWRRQKEGRPERICIWCKYGDEKADIIKKETKVVSQTFKTCHRCKRTRISTTFFEKEEK